jgi:transcriptional regulator with XRE-family HTH domain
MDRLAELRERRALTLRELAEMSGVAADTINQIELGHRKPRPSTLRKLARALEVDIDQFYAEPALAGKAEAPETGRLPEWATTSDLNVLNQNANEASSEELRELVIQLAKDLRWNRTLEDARNESRSESIARVLNQARINALAEELRRRGEEPPEEYVAAFRQWLKAMTPPPDAESQSNPGRSVPEAG